MNWNDELLLFLKTGRWGTMVAEAKRGSRRAVGTGCAGWGFRVIGGNGSLVAAKKNLKGLRPSEGEGEDVRQVFLMSRPCSARCMGEMPMSVKMKKAMMTVGDGYDAEVVGREQAYSASTRMTMPLMQGAVLKTPKRAVV